MSNNSSKPIVFSGVQPSGRLHLGNYIGALSLWVENQTKYDNIFCIVDLHAITIPEGVNPEGLHRKTREVAGLYIACGIDPTLSAIFVQSHVPAHSELAWILNCVTPVGWLERMTQYKVKSAQMESVSTGLLDYPVLQAADILLYNTNLVPVGEDQRQHIELARDVAERFNHLFGNAFVLPTPLTRDSGARIMGLDDPTAKMSKSIGEKRVGHSIGLLDPPQTIRRSIMKAVTDSGDDVRFQSASSGVLNLLTIYQALTGQAKNDIESRFEGKGYGTLKRELVDLVIAFLGPIQERYNRVMADPDYVESTLREGCERVRPVAESTLKRVKELVGLG